MKKKTGRVAERIATLPDRFRVNRPRKFRLADWDPDDTAGIESSDDAKEGLASGVERIKELQERLFAENRWAVLALFQAMDAAGKDSTIEHVMSGVNPA